MAFPEEIRRLAANIGKAGVNALYPNEFEYYAITLELTDSSGETIEYLTFPVSPESMSYDNQSLANIKKSMSGVSALDNETFFPPKIEMTGTFGRKFKILINNELGDISIQKKDESTLSGQFKAFKQNAVNVKEAIFDPRLKTGYGTLKVLEAILSKSHSLDKYNQSYRLYLYNPALGHNWLVKHNSDSYSMDRTNSNMLWKYNLQFTAIAPLDRVKTSSQTRSTLQQSTGIAALQGGLNALTSNIRSSF